MRISFSEAVRNKITDKFADSAFSFYDFADLMDEYCRTRKMLNDVLRDLRERKLIYVFGEMSLEGQYGNQPKIYKVVPGAKFRIATPKGMRDPAEDWKKLRTPEEQYQNECAIRALAAFDRMKSGL